MKHTIQINHAAKVQFFEPVLVSDLREAIDELPVRLLGTRDKAVLLVSFLGKFQRTKLSRLDLCDVSISPSGVKIAIKGNARGMPELVFLSRSAELKYCPVASLEAWISLSGAANRPGSR